MEKTGNPVEAINLIIAFSFSIRGEFQEHAECKTKFEHLDRKGSQNTDNKTESVLFLQFEVIFHFSSIAKEKFQ